MKKRNSLLDLWGWPVGLGALWLLFLFVLAVWSVNAERDHVKSMAEREAKAFFQQIVITRSWNAAHGGVYVVATEASPPNEYIMENERTLTTEDGVLLTKINPAYMTRQISTIAKNERGIQFHITSLDPVRRDNIADAWEVGALKGFNKGVKERFEMVNGGAGEVFRYMAPLYAKQECMRCHKEFGHTGKAILGGISVSFPAGPYIDARKHVIAQTHLAFTLIFLVGLVGICGSTYLVQRKRDEAEQANRTKSVFLANMSHDMRTPLNGIMGLTELMQKSGLGPNLDRYAEMVRHSAWTLLEIVTDITDFSRLESGRLDLSEKVFDVHELLDDALAVFKFETANRGISLGGEVSDGVPRLLKGDPFRLKQVLTNLVGNAVKFTGKGHVHVRISLADAMPSKGNAIGENTVRLRFEVEDTGIGIPEDEQKHIFESFRQVDSSYAKTQEGTGLGLAICSQLVSMMNGTISVTSEQGKGATFFFDILLSLPEEGEDLDARPVESSAGTPCCSPCQVLVVEDNPLNQIFASEVLKDEGHLVTVAENGIEALDALRGQDFDIVFMDVQMPEMDGLEATRRIRAGEAGESGRKVPIVATTAFAVAGDKEQCLEAGMDGYVMKPLASSQIIDAMARYSGKAVRKEKQDVQDEKRVTEVHIDIDTALERLGGRRELFDKLVATFLDDTPPKLDALRAAVKSGDMDEVLRLSHGIKNSAGMIQAVGMADKAQDVELCVREERFDDVPGLHQAFDKAARDTLVALKSLGDA